MERIAILVAVVAVAASACDQLVTSPSRYSAVRVATTRRDGTPIGLVPLVLSTGQRIMGYDTTDTNGYARFDKVPEGPAYGVYAGVPTGYERTEKLLGGALTGFRSFVLHRDSVPTISFQFLKVGPGTITAKVIDQSGAGLSNIDVELYTAAQSLGKQKTAVDGTVRFAAVPFGIYGVRAYRPAAYRDLGEKLSLDTDSLIIEEGITESRVLTLRKCEGAIALRVSDATRGGAANVRTELFQVAGVVDAKRTATDGTVRYAELACGNFGVRVLPAAEWVVTPGRGTEFADGVIVNRGVTREVTLPVQYNNCRGSVRVTVVDQTGVPVSGVVLTLFSAYDDPVAMQTTASTAVTFSDLGCGPERGVSIAAPTGWTATPGRGGSFMDGLVVTNGGVANVQFTLTRNTP